MYLLKTLSAPKPKERNQESYSMIPATQFMRRKTGLKTKGMIIFVQGTSINFYSSAYTRIKQTLGYLDQTKYSFQPPTGSYPLKKVIIERTAVSFLLSTMRFLTNSHMASNPASKFK